MDDEVKNLPPGYKFSPSDEDLLEFYLKPKVYGQKLPCNVVKEKEIYGPNVNPWDIFNASSTSWIVLSGKSEKTVYVFTRLTKKAVSSSCRASNKKKSSPVGKGPRYVKKAGCGTWHNETGPKGIMDHKGKNVIGYKKMPVYQINDVSGKSAGINLDEVGYWKMHEYSLCGFDDYVLCEITWDTSKKVKVVCLCPKTISSSSTKPKAQSEFATPFTGSEEVGTSDQRLLSEHYSEISEFGLVHDNYSVQEAGSDNYGLVGSDKSFDVEINMMDPEDLNKGLVECDYGGNHIVEEQGYDQVFDENVHGTEEALLSTFSNGFELDGLLDIEEDLFLDWPEEEYSKVYNGLSEKDMEMFNNQLQEFSATLSSVHGNNNDEQHSVQNYSSQVLSGKRKSCEAEQLGKKLCIGLSVNTCDFVRVHQLQIYEAAWSRI